MPDFMGNRISLSKCEALTTLALPANFHPAKLKLCIPRKTLSKSPTKRIDVDIRVSCALSISNKSEACQAIKLIEDLCDVTDFTFGDL
ncbi:hypothetical protein [Cyanobium sp. PCC 7001]|uniref:hypothetical protein n=1 Tax=Cyanobium sp. PCC 7001 TaxID=180281 RepID=UPI001CEC98E0|nr:hypothetical protein [Cyanobium sp. PCC 7001]